MDKNFSIYTSPLSSESKLIRRNSLFASSICIFIGLTNELPASFALWGAKFSTSQQLTVGWFILCVSGYLFIHFISIAGVEVARWLQPIVDRNTIESKPLPVSDEDFADHEENKKNRIIKHETEKKLKYLYKLVYLKLFIEVVFPVLIGMFGLYKLFSIIPYKCT